MGLFHEGKPDRSRVVSGQRFGLVVEVDEQGLGRTGLDEAVRVTVKGCVEALPVEEVLNVLDQHLSFEVGHGTGLRGRECRRVAEGEHVGRSLRLQRVFVNRYEAEFVAEPAPAEPAAEPTASEVPAEAGE